MVLSTHWDFLYWQDDIFILNQAPGCPPEGGKYPLCLWVHKTCSGITKKLVEDPNYICPSWKGESRPIDGQTMTEMDVDGTMLDVKPLSATWVVWCALVGAVTMPLLPDAVWPAENS